MIVLAIAQIQQITCFARAIGGRQVIILLYPHGYYHHESVSIAILHLNIPTRKQNRTNRLLNAEQHARW